MRASEVRQVIDAAAEKLFGRDFKGVYRINPCRPKGPGALMILVDAALAGTGDWETERAIFELDEFRNLGSREVVELVKARVTDAIEAIDRRTVEADRHLLPLSWVTGKVVF
jgi:hypothetical protein